MYCCNCGKEINENTNFCPNCGSSNYLVDREEKMSEAHISDNLKKSEEVVRCSCSSCGYKGYMEFVKYKYHPIIRIAIMLVILVIFGFFLWNSTLPWILGYLLGIGIYLVVELLLSKTKYVKCPKCEKNLILKSYAEIIQNLDYVPIGKEAKSHIKKKFWTQKKKEILKRVAFIALILLAELPSILKVKNALEEKKAREKNSEYTIDNNQGEDKWNFFKEVKLDFVLNYGETNQEVVLDNSNIVSAVSKAMSDGKNRQYLVVIRFDQKGTKILEEVTNENLGKKLYIVCNGDVISEPVISTAILNGETMITGLESYEEAVTLANALNP